MTVAIDLDVLLDVIQEREPHYEASARLLTAVLNQQINGTIPGHGITTIYYIVRKYSSRAQAEDVVDWLLERFSVLAPSADDFRYARTLDITDYEDAVVAALAERAGCDFIVSRNVGDYQNAPVPVVTPRQMLNELQRPS